MLLSFLIPAMQFELKRPAEEDVVSQNSSLYASSIAPMQNSRVDTTQSGMEQSSELQVDFSWEEVLFTTYLSITGIMLAVFIFQAIKLLLHMRKVNQRIGKLKLIFKPDGFTNCSFFNYVFIDRKELTDHELDIVLKHEFVHFSRYHSLDKIFMLFCKALIWFNPLVYLYDRALEQVHEYEADKELSVAIGSKSYATILLEMAVKRRGTSLAHSFAGNPIKERIKMLFTNQSKKMKKLTYLAAIPFVTLLTWVFAVQIVYAKSALEILKKADNSITVAESINLKPTEPVKKIKAEILQNKVQQEDTLRMVDGPTLGKNPEVIINGKSYPSDILTKISPRCIRTTRTSMGKIELTTDNNQIEYATAIDRYNIRISRKETAVSKFYVRYQQKEQDGSPYDWVQVKSGGSTVGVSLPVDSKLLLLIDGKQFTEEQAKTFSIDQFKSDTVSASDFTDPALKAKYGKQYKSIIKISTIKEKTPTDTIAFNPPSRRKVEFRNSGGLEVEDGNGKFSYSADSIIYNKGFRDVKLLGRVKMSNDLLDIKADEMRFNGTDHIALGINVHFSQKGKIGIKNASFVKFDLLAGTYQVLEQQTDYNKASKTF